MRKLNRKWTADEVREVLEAAARLRAEGRPVKAAGQLFGVSADKVYRICYLYPKIWKPALQRELQRVADQRAEQEATAKPGPQMPLELFIRVCYLPPKTSRPARVKMRWLVDHLAAAIQRVPLVSDLNAITLAALTYHVRNQLRRSVATTKGMKQYFRSVWRLAADLEIVADLPKSVQASGRRSPRRNLLTWKMRQRIAKAVRMYARGATWEEIAASFQLTPEAIAGWRKRHRAFWEATYDQAMLEACERVKQIAGCDEMLAVPDFPQLADRCRRWWGEHQGGELFPTPPSHVTLADPSQHTVQTFFESYVLPVCLQEAAPQTVGIYRKSAAKFATVCGNPPLAKIDNLLLARYVDALRKMEAKGKGGKLLSLVTVKMYVKHLQTILDKAGPPQRRCRDAAGYIPMAPWVKPPRTELGEPQIVADDVFWRVYAAAAEMTWPRIEGVLPDSWWRGLLVTARFTGLRSRSLFGLEWKHVDLKGKRLILPPSILKNRQKLVLPLAGIVSEHIVRLRGNRESVFALPASKEVCRRRLHELQTAAGLSESEHFGLHSLRRTAITALWIKSPGAAQLLAGHGSPIITQQHYVNHESALSVAMGEMADAAMAGKAVAHE